VREFEVQLGGGAGILVMHGMSEDGEREESSSFLVLWLEQLEKMKENMFPKERFKKARGCRHGSSGTALA
jgi:hypothetical protein